MRDTKFVDELSFDRFLLSTYYPWCWWCGRTGQDVPLDWCAPFLIERAHIVNLPRVLDRRACVLLCSLCHRSQHGGVFSSMLAVPSLRNMLWIKRRFDPVYFSRVFLQASAIARLPSCLAPPAVVQAAYKSRHGRYPILVS